MNSFTELGDSVSPVHLRLDDGAEGCDRDAREYSEDCPLVIDHASPVVVSWLPQYHDMGLIGCYLYPALKGGTTYGFAPMDFIQRPVLWFDTITDVPGHSDGGTELRLRLLPACRRLPKRAWKTATSARFGC